LESSDLFFQIIRARHPSAQPGLATPRFSPISERSLIPKRCLRRCRPVRLPICGRHSGGQKLSTKRQIIPDSLAKSWYSQTCFRGSIGEVKIARDSNPGFRNPGYKGTFLKSVYLPAGPFGISDFLIRQHACRPKSLGQPITVFGYPFPSPDPCRLFCVNTATPCAKPTPSINWST